MCFHYIEVFGLLLGPMNLGQFRQPFHSPLSRTWDILIAKSMSDTTENLESTFHTQTPLHGPYYWSYLCEGFSVVCCHVTSSIQQAFLDIGACEYHNILMHWLHQPILNHFTVCMTLQLIARGRPKIFIDTEIVWTLEPARLCITQWPRSEFNAI